MGHSLLFQLVLTVNTTSDYVINTGRKALGGEP